MRQQMYGTNIPNEDQKKYASAFMARQMADRQQLASDLNARAEEILREFAQGGKKDKEAGLIKEGDDTDDRKLQPAEVPTTAPAGGSGKPLGGAPVGTAPAGGSGKPLGGEPVGTTPASESKPTFMGVSADPALEEIVTGKPAAAASTKPKSIIDSPAADKPSFVRSGSREDQFGQLMRDAARIADEGGLMMTDKKALEQAQQARVARGQAPLSMSKEQYNEFLMRNAYKDSSKHPEWMERTPADELAAKDAARDAARAAANPATSGGSFFSQAQDMIRGAVEKAPATAEYLMQQGQMLPQSELSFEEGSNDPDMVATALAESADHGSQFDAIAEKRKQDMLDNTFSEVGVNAAIRRNIRAANKSMQDANAMTFGRLLGASGGALVRGADALLGGTPQRPKAREVAPFVRTPSTQGLSQQELTEANRDAARALMGAAFEEDRTDRRSVTDRFTEEALPAYGRGLRRQFF